MEAHNIAYLALKQGCPNPVWWLGRVFCPTGQKALLLRNVGSQMKATSTWEYRKGSLFFPVGHKTQLVRSPRGLDVGTPVWRKHNTSLCHFYVSILLVQCIPLAPYFRQRKKKTDELRVETFPFFPATKSEPTLSGPVIYISNDFCRLCPDSQGNLSFSFPGTWKSRLCTPLFKKEKKKKKLKSQVFSWQYWLYSG